MNNHTEIQYTTICSTSQYMLATSVPPYWSCQNQSPIKTISGWDCAIPEYNASNIGRVDVGLLKDSKFLIAIEVLHSSAMTASKVSELNRKKLKFLELVTDPIYYKGLWIPEMGPLKCIQTHEGVWKCNECAKGWDSIKFENVYSIFDVYKKKGTKNGFSFITREVYACFIRTDDDTKYIVKGGYNIINNQHTYDCKSSLVATFKTENELLTIRNNIENYKNTLSDQGNIVSNVLPWPGTSIEHMFAEDEFCREISPSNIRSIQGLNHYLQRLYRLKYVKKRKYSHWELL
eukprot:TRINITY_DN1756_c0_g1_i13.p1 TRINITY_DN1756_c0_g1~~TRINITY_DN1756_c0_g1_i13.p1  ORF type:complete len:290 (+),score=47.49 TRINITY_DN1756_c0_g1_i13:353-1222(+)